MDIYRELLEQLQGKGYKLISYSDYIRGNDGTGKYAILRHDVDKRAENSLQTAQIEHAIGARASYYFRIVGESNKPEIIRAIAALGHEIGYHYEDMALCEGKIDAAYDHFTTWLDYFRQYYAVETICMHGAPTNKYDGRELWKKYDYKALGIIGEPYFDTDFSDVLYLTDTGRCWDGYKVSVRDKIPQYQPEWTARGWSFHTSRDILSALAADNLPEHMMLTTHPQRWTNNRMQWWQERIEQNCKNIIKRVLIQVRQQQSKQ